MAFPTIQTADTKAGVQTSNSNSWTLIYPSNLASGDLIVAFVATDGDSNGETWPAGWVGDSHTQAAVSLHRGHKLSDGTETGNFTFTLGGGASEQGAWRVFRITGWGGVFGTAANWANTANDGDAVAASDSTGSPNTNPNPPSLDPNNWATEDTLWFAICAADTSRTISVYPLSDNQTQNVSGGAGGATLGVCTANSAVSSLDPSTFTISTSDEWEAMTVAVRPGGAQTYTKAGTGVLI